MTITIPSYAKNVIKCLTEAGFKAYFVGGCVRDSLLDKAIYDWDITTSAKSDEIIKVFGDSVVATYNEFGTVLVCCKMGDVKRVFEITTFRVERYYDSLGRFPKCYFINDLEEDLKRRDFTINAIACDENGVIVNEDSLKDLKEGKLVCCEEPNKTFTDDPLRILRLLRFAEKYNFSIDTDTLVAALRNSFKLHELSKERIKKEFFMILDYFNYYSYEKREDLKLLFDTIVLELFPEVYKLIFVKQNNKHHFTNAYYHTLIAIASTEFLLIKIALFFHDTGKFKTETTDEFGYNHYYEHEKFSVEIAEKYLVEYRFSKDNIKTILSLIKYHNYEAPRNKKSLVRLCNKLETSFYYLFLMRLADGDAHVEETSELNREKMYKALNMYDEMLRNNEVFSLKDLDINGNDIIKEFNVKGKQVGELLKFALEGVINEEVKNNKKDLIKYISTYDKE